MKTTRTRGQGLHPGTSMAWTREDRARGVQGKWGDGRVSRDFEVSRPNGLRVSDMSYVATWREDVYTNFVIDAYTRRILGWRASNSLHANLAVDALEQTLHQLHRRG